MSPRSPDIPPIVFPLSMSLPSPEGPPSPATLPLSGAWAKQATPNDKPSGKRISHFSPRPKSVLLHSSTSDRQLPLESPSPFKPTRPRQIDSGSSGGAPLSPRFALTDSHRQVPRLNLFNDQRPMPELPPVPGSSPPPPIQIDPSPDDDVEGEVCVEFLVFERYQVIEPSQGGVPGSPRTPPSSPQWPSSPRSSGVMLSPRGHFLGNKPRDTLQ